MLALEAAAGKHSCTLGLTITAIVASEVVHCFWILPWKPDVLTFTAAMDFPVAYLSAVASVGPFELFAHLKELDAVQL